MEEIRKPNQLRISNLKCLNYVKTALTIKDS